jgi:hypothetical protein
MGNGSAAFGGFSIVIGDAGSILALLGLGGALGVANIYFSDFPLPRAQIIALDDLLKDIEESADLLGMESDINQSV